MTHIKSRYVKKYKEGDNLDTQETAEQKAVREAAEAKARLDAGLSTAAFNPTLQSQATLPASQTVRPAATVRRVALTNSTNNPDVKTRQYRGVDWSAEDYETGKNLTKQQNLYKSIWNPKLEAQAQASGQSIEKDDLFLTPEDQEKAIQEYNAANGTNLSVEDYNKNVIGGLNTVFGKYDKSGYNLRGQNESGAGKQGGTNLYGYRNYSAVNDFKEETDEQSHPGDEPAIEGDPAAIEPGIEPTPAPITDPMIPFRRRRFNPLGSGYYTGKIKEADKVNIPRVKLSHPVITQPDVDKPISQMAGQAAGMMQRNRSTDTASRVGMAGNLFNSLTSGMQQVYDNSAKFTEAKRDGALDLINKEKVMNHELDKYEEVDDVNYQRTRLGQVLAGAARMNQQTAYTNALRTASDEERYNKQLEAKYDLDASDYDARIEDINKKMVGAPKAEIAKLIAERDALVQQRRKHLGGYIFSNKNGGVIYSRFAKGGKFSEKVALEGVKQGNRIELSGVKFKNDKQLVAFKEVMRRNMEFIKMGHDLLKTNMNAIAKAYNVKMPKHAIPQSKL